MKLFEIGQKIKEFRKNKGLTQEQLSNISAISRVTLGKIERGQMGALYLLKL